MFDIFKKILLTSLLSINIITTTEPIVSSGLFQQIVPELTKKINPNKPSDQEQIFINACRAFKEFYTTSSGVSFENFQAIKSIDLYSDILPKYVHPITIVGRICTAAQASSFTDDLATLHKKQKLIVLLEQNPKIIITATKALKQAAQAEQKFFRLFKHMDEKEQADQQNQNAKVYFSMSPFKKWNEDRTALEVTNRIKLLRLLLPFASVSSMPVIVDFMIDRSSSGFWIKLASSIGKNIANMHKLPQRWIEGLTPGLGYSGAITYTALIFGLNAWDLYSSGKEIKEGFDIVYEKQQTLLATGHLLSSMHIIKNLIAQNSEFKELLQKEYQILSDLFDKHSKKTSVELKLLVELLQTSSFQGDSSYLLSQQGKILAAYHLLNRIKGELIPYIETIGNIDTNIAILNLYHQFKDHQRVHFCLPEFIQADTPVFEAQGFWHPLIDPNIVVTNDIFMNKTNANLIITGPNAGGKTTSIMSMIINIIFAQSFGISPSTSLRLTPFAKIHSYLDITTNLQEGLSLFAAEVDRSKKLKASILSCTPGQKTFTIIDELFSGTAPDVAADLGFKFATQLGNISHSMTLITTHFPRFTDLEKETKRYQNYKVADATIADNGSIVYPYTLVPGISQQNIAAQMLEQEGIL